jgi:hypothetical protein
MLLLLHALRHLLCQQMLLLLHHLLLYQALVAVDHKLLVIKWTLLFSDSKLLQSLLIALHLFQQKKRMFDA